MRHVSGGVERLPAARHPPSLPLSSPRTAGNINRGAHCCSQMPPTEHVVERAGQQQVYHQPLRRAERSPPPWRAGSLSVCSDGLQLGNRGAKIAACAPWTRVPHPTFHVAVLHVLAVLTTHVSSVQDSQVQCL